MDLFEAIYSRRSVRSFAERDIDQRSLEKILDAARWAPSSCNQQLWHFIVLRDSGIKEELVKNAGSAALIAKAPVVILSCYHKANMKEAIETISGATENMLLAATALGIGSLWIDSIGNEKTIRKILRIPGEYAVISFVLLGYPKNDIPKPPPHKELREIVHAESFGSARAEEFPHDPDRWTIESIRRYQTFYCRKTDLGTKMDIISPAEEDLLKDALSGRKDILDLFSYDGSSLPCFPDTRVWSMNLDHETSLYVSHATDRTVLSVVYADNRIGLNDDSVGCASCLYKIERIPRAEWVGLFKEVRRVLRDDGEIVLVFRQAPSLYGLFYKLLLTVFKDDVRKTALYSYFGPYKPLGVKDVQKALEEAGFRSAYRRHFFIPPFFEELYQLALQYRVSGGTSFLHRVYRPTVIARVLKRYFRWQGTGESSFGSTIVMNARKA